jgi:biotin carboxyl carrier protein
MKRYQITVNGRSFDVRLLSDPLQDQVEVEVNGKRFTVQVRALPPEAKTTETVRPPATSGSAPPTEVKTRTPSGSSVVAPLPGVIKSIAVRPGQPVSAGDELLVIEAMKMDNVIRATRKAIVETIYTAEGRQVTHGELMLEYRR